MQPSAISAFALPEGRQHAALTCDAAHLMPNLRDYVLRSDPRVEAQGPSVKGDYYSRASRGPFDLVAFRVACNSAAAFLPFLVIEFETHVFHLDFDGDVVRQAAAAASTAPAHLPECNTLSPQ